MKNSAEAQCYYDSAGLINYCRVQASHCCVVVVQDSSILRQTVAHHISESFLEVGMSGKSSASALILGLGVTAVFSISFLFYSFFWKTKSNQPKILPPADESSANTLTAGINTTSSPPDVKKVEEEEECTTGVPEAVAAPVPSPPHVVVEEDDSDEEEEDDAESMAAQLALKTSYDDALRLAKKLLAGEKFFKAAEKFSEAIKLAEELGGSASKDITTLYNNRSAMYEKCGELDLALTDIGLVLAMEALHLKARIRRARIYEVQNKIKLSCIDYMVGMLIEMTKNLPPSHQEKIEALVKQQAVSESHAVVEAIRASESRPLPPRSHCRHYFEIFPSYHKWRALYTTTSVDRDTLVQAAGGDFEPESEEGGDLAERLEAVHSLACFDIANGAITKAFSSVAKVCSFLLTNQAALEDAALSAVIADLFTIHGTYFHLCGNYNQAKDYFSLALNKKPLPLGYESALQLASIHLEVDSPEEASKLYEDIASSLAPEDRASEAWLCIHRMSEWVTRDAEGKFRPEALGMATATVNKALALSEDFGEDVVMKSCHLMATLKLVTILSQTKMQMGLQPDNDDVAKQKECIEKATALFPKNETVVMLGVDLLSQEGRFDEALSSCDQMTRTSADPKDSLHAVMKANVLCQMGMTKYSEAQQLQNQSLLVESGQLLQQGQALYAEAIVAEPNCVEALIQLAQLKSMMGPGEMEEALSLCNQALPQARSRDEALDIMQLKLMMDNRLVAIQEMRANGMQI